MATTPHNLPNLAIYHPALQELVLAEAAKAGAEVRRGAKVREVKIGNPPTVMLEANGRTEELTPRLVVGADGRILDGAQVVRLRDSTRNRSILHRRTAVRRNTRAVEHQPRRHNPGARSGGLSFSSRRRPRACLQRLSDQADFRLQGERSIDRFVGEALRCGIPPEYDAGARASGPLASFISADHWVENPYRDGVVLIGDAAGASDPIWGQGLSLTCRDARVLTDLLRENQDWAAAGQAYARGHDQYFTNLREADNCMRELLVDCGPQRRAPCARAAAGRTGNRADARPGILRARPALRRGRLPPPLWRLIRIARAR